MIAICGFLICVTENGEIHAIFGVTNSSIKLKGIREIFMYIFVWRETHCTTSGSVDTAVMFDFCVFRG
ncbi:hypothetical protein AT239_04695 [Bartonella henselae]|nr:hypothetical protein AT240_07525 [Bartonella henselae]OLL56169.1 hypothetical protein AT239_04695 [Bartonella henselae]